MDAVMIVDPVQYQRRRDERDDVSMPLNKSLKISIGENRLCGSISLGLTSQPTACS
jgi:hypothetical protein